MNIEVSNHMATIEDAAVVKLDATYNKKEGSTQKPQNRQNQKLQQSVRPQIQPKTTSFHYFS